MSHFNFASLRDAIQENKDQVKSIINNPIFNDKIKITKRKVYEDKYTYPNGFGPYHVDAIPIILKDKFKMPKVNTSNLPTTTLVGTQDFDTRAFPEMVIFVPSKRDTVQTTPLFKQQTVDQNDNLGSFNMSLEDWCLTNAREGLVGKTLNDKITAFRNLITPTSATFSSSTEARTTALNNIKNDSTYKFIKENVKVPFKVWDQKVVNGEFSFTDLTDENSVPLMNQLLDGSYFKTQVVDTTWTLDEMLPIEKNTNACGPLDGNGQNSTPLNANNKMGLFIFNLGNGQTMSNTPIPAAIGSIASMGYVVILNFGNPINSGLLNIKSKSTLSSLFSNNTISQYVSYDLNNDYFINQNSAYTNEGNATTAQPNRANFRNAALSTPCKLIVERQMYQQICVLRKLGLYDKINWSNVVHGGLSGGGYNMIVSHDIQPVAGTALTTPAKATIFTLNNSSGVSTGVKPNLFRIKALIGWQSIFTDLTNVTLASQKNGPYTTDLGRNNKYNVGIQVLKVPLIYMTGDGDAYDKINTWENLFNTTAQTIFQWTKKASDSPTEIVFANSMALYKPSNSHLPVIDFNNGEYTSFYPLSFLQGWTTGGYELPQYVEFPSMSNTVETGIQSELAYVQYDDIKTIFALHLAVHRFLGVKFPVPTNAFGNLGWRTDMMPTHCDISTEHQYMRVGPEGEITYGTDYGLIMKSPNLTLTTTKDVVSGSSVSVNEVGSVNINVDSNKNLITDANSFVIMGTNASSQPTKYKITVEGGVLKATAI